MSSKKSETKSDLVKVDEFAIISGEEDLSAVLEENLGGGGIEQFDLDRVTVPTGGGLAFTVPSLEGDKPAEAIEGVILGIRDGRSYWERSFDETGGGDPPDCVSDDMKTGKGTPGGSCDECPLSQWGSDPMSKRGQACKQQRLLLVARKTDFLPLIVQLPPTSLKACRQFLVRMSGRGVSRFGAVVSIGLEKDKNADGTVMSKATFKLAGMLSPEDKERMKAIGQKIEGAFAAASIAPTSTE